jgi:hypothetical protein
MDRFVQEFNHDLEDPVISPLNAWSRACDARKERDDLQGHLEDLEVNGIGIDGTLDHVV